MTFFKVLLVILVVLWLISLIRVGGRVSYGAAGLFVFLLLGPVKLCLFPAKKEKEGEWQPKPKKEKRKKKKPVAADKQKKEPKEGQPGTLARLMKLLPVAGQACGALKRKIRVDDLRVELIWGGSDPAAIALGYGQANAALGILWPLFANNFKVKRHSFEIRMDYGCTQPAVELQAALTFTIGQIITLGVHYGVKALVIWVKSGRPSRRKASRAEVKKPKKQEAMSHE